MLATDLDGYNTMEMWGGLDGQGFYWYVGDNDGSVNDAYLKYDGDALDVIFNNVDVGIDTTNPIAELDVQGNVIITDGTESCSQTGNGDLCVDNDLEVDGSIQVLNDMIMADDSWVGIGSGLERIQFDASGNIVYVAGGNFGVGNSAPTSALHVAGVTNSSIGYSGNPTAIMKLDDPSTASSALYDFGDGSAETTSKSVHGSWDGDDFIIGTDGTYLVRCVLLMTSSSVQTVTMTIDVGGTNIMTKTPTVHSSVDPVDRTIEWIEGMSTSDQVSCEVDAVGAGTITLETGSTMLVQRVG